MENGFKDISNKSSAGDTDKFYRILAMYTKFVDYDEHKEEKCRVIGDLIERLYDKKEYFIIANIFNGKGMFIDGHHGAKLKYTAKPEFFIEKIIELNRSISVNTDIIDYVKKILNSLIVGVELTNYKIRQGNSDIYDDVKKIYREFTRGASFYSTVIEIIDGNNCSDELNKVMEMINDTIIKMIMCLKSFLNIEFLNDSYTDKNEKIYNSRRGQQLKCDGNNILIGSLFYSVAVLIEYYLKNNSDENTAQILSDLHNKIGFEMYYAIGEIHNPFDVKNFSVNEIIEKYPEYFLDLEGAPLERFFCPIRDEYKQKRHDLLASSMIKMMEEADREHAANLICMCFNKDFLIEHPLEVLAALSEKSWLLNYYRNHELSKEEKIQIMDTWSQNIYKLILSKTQYIHNTEEAKREIAHIFKKITDLYMLLLPDFTELNKDLIGTPFLENRKQFYSSVFMLSKWYSIDIDIHTDQLMKELTDNNIPYLDRIVECIKRLSGYGHRKEAVELKQNLFSLYTREYDENNMESYAKKVIVLMILQKLAKGMHMTEYYEKITKEMESAPLEVYAYIRDHSDKVTLAMAQKVTKIMARRFICRIVDLIDVDCKTEEIYDRVFDDSKLIEEYRKYMAYRLDAMFVTFDYPVYPAEVLILMYFEFYLSGWDEFNYYVFEEHEEQKIEMFYRSFNMNKEEVNVELLYFLMTLYGKNIGKYILNHVHNYQLDLENRTFFDHLLDYVEDDEY